MKPKRDCKLPSDQNQSDDFFRNINIQFLIHELKGPLDVIQTNIRMLLEFEKDAGPLTNFQKKALKRSIRSSAKLRDIIHSLLEVGSSQAGRINLQQFDVVRCTAEVLVNSLETVICGESDAPDADSDLTHFLADNGINLVVSPEVLGTCIRQDKTKFMYIVGNLVRNSLQHKASQVTVQLTLEETNLHISVSDDGAGIAPEDRKALFKGYTQKRGGHGKGRRKGHGLGLASSRIMARYLGGDISIDTQYSEGAQFVVRLPLAMDDQAAREDGFEVHDLDSTTPA